MNEQLEQKVARAIAEEAGYGSNLARQEDIDHAQEYYRPHARAALKAHSDWLAEQGLVVVPREPSKDICYAAGYGEHSICSTTAHFAYKAMISAAHQQEE